jgi:hypothetical protein
MGYLVANPFGDIIAYSGSYIPNGVFIGDETLFNAITAEPYNYKWIDDQLITSQRPSVYHKWLGTEWVLDVESLSEAKASQWLEIKKFRDDRLEHGGFPVGSYWFHSDVYAQANYTDLLMMGANIPANLMWKTMSGAFVLMTQTLAQQILGAKALQKNLTFVKAEQHRAAMEASSDPLNYDYTTGWPPIYGE